MYEKLYSTDSKFRQHLDSPLLQERMTFLLERSRAGNKNDRLRVIASYLVYAVHSLHLHDGNNANVHINDLIRVCKDYRTYHSIRILKLVIAIDEYRYCDVVCNIYIFLPGSKLMAIQNISIYVFQFFSYFMVFSNLIFQLLYNSTMFLYTNPLLFILRMYIGTDKHLIYSQNVNELHSKDVSSSTIFLFI